LNFHYEVAGREDQLRLWAGRDLQVLYEVNDRSGRLTIVAVRKKDESTYKRLDLQGENFRERGTSGSPAAGPR
jgi:hypothetical protein